MVLFLLATEILTFLLINFIILIMLTFRRNLRFGVQFCLQLRSVLCLIILAFNEVY